MTKSYAMGRQNRARSLTAKITVLTTPSPTNDPPLLRHSKPLPRRQTHACLEVFTASCPVFRRKRRSSTVKKRELDLVARRHPAWTVTHNLRPSFTFQSELPSVLNAISSNRASFLHRSHLGTLVLLRLRHRPTPKQNRPMCRQQAPPSPRPIKKSIPKIKT